MFPISICVATTAMLSGIGGAALFIPIFVIIFPILGPEYPLTTAAAIDRLVHHSVILELNVASYRMETAKNSRQTKGQVS